MAAGIRAALQRLHRRAHRGRRRGGLLAL